MDRIERSKLGDHFFAGDENKPFLFPLFSLLAKPDGLLDERMLVATDFLHVGELWLIVQKG